MISDNLDHNEDDAKSIITGKHLQWTTGHIGIDHNVLAGGPRWESNPLLVKGEMNYISVETTCRSTYDFLGGNKQREYGATAMVSFLLYTLGSEG